jgi:membrane protease YdiL (CAAX protease family)
MDETVVVFGVVAEATAWWFVSSRGASVWRVVTPVLVALGVVALVFGPPAWSPDVNPIVAAAVGLGAGVALYGATRAFVAVARSWQAFRRHSAALYSQRGDLSLAAALLLSAGVTATAEEVFWRGFAQPELAGTFEPWVGALVAWAAFVVANALSRNLAILASAVVGGFVWSALGLWGGGALAPLGCHVVWTGLMLSFPVVSREAISG